MKVPGLAPFHCDCGTIAWPAMFSRLVYWAVGKVSVTVLPEVLTLEIFRPSRFTAVLFFSMLNVKATSAGVIAVPLFHFTPWRIVKAIVLPPLDHA